MARLPDPLSHMPPPVGRPLYLIARDTPVHGILELGFGRGASTCYLAAGLAAQPSAAGSTVFVMAVDRTDLAFSTPSIQEVLAATGLADRVWPVVTPSSYTWFLYRLIQTRSDGDRCMPCFDLCYIDGAHEWAVDGFAFLLVDKRLTPRGWLLFDDLDWTYASSRTLAWAPSSLELPDDEYRTAQVGEVFDLLVRQHPNYGGATG